ncbi:transposase [Accumulibacter sp.]|uniref:transposase n=1 Tax=Accumulibacter sp. TaxID=2053492 RepID=UPI00258A4EC5|nr:transposase [Accumulibacter sp.]
MRALPSGEQAFAHTQALWRFLGNARVSASDLGAPLLALAREGVAEGCEEYALAVHDWSRLNYNTHSRKQDRLQMTHATDLGYELQSTVLVADRDGAPLAAVAQNLCTAHGVWSSRSREMLPQRPHLDELTERMDGLEAQVFAKRLVHLVDREADSIFHQRQWSARNRLWLVRVKAAGRVRYQKKATSLQRVADELCFAKVRPVEHQGKPAVQWLASAEVTIVRPARPKRLNEQGQRVPPIPGVPLTVRLIVSRICTPDGKPLADWFLLSNLPGTVSDAQIALWYYWRWRIESYFKLLKQAGQQLERWGAGIRPGHSQAPVDRRSGLCLGVATHAHRGGLRRTDACFPRAAFRTADEALHSCYHPGTSRWPPQPLRHARNPETLFPR